MPTRDTNANRMRSEAIRVMVTQRERAELQKAADEAGMVLSAFLRVRSLEAARRGSAIKGHAPSVID